MRITPAERTLNWRENQKTQFGTAGFKERDKLRKRAERARKKAQASATQATPEPAQSNTFDNLVDEIFNAKQIQLDAMNPPRSIKRASVVQQLTKLINLRKKMDGSNSNNFEFLRDMPKVIKFINDNWNTPNSKNAQIQAIASVLAVLKGYEIEYKFYSDYSTIKRKEINHEADDNMLSQKESANILPWSDIQYLYRQVRDTRDKALIAIYTLLPPRRAEDVSLLTIASEDVGLSTNLNYLIWDVAEGNPYIIYNRYKTDKAYGKVKIPVPSSLAVVLADYIRSASLNYGDILFGTKSKKYYKNFSEVVSNTFKKYSGKKLSVNLLRHSYISDIMKKNLSTNNKNIIAREMGHNFITQASYNRIGLGD